jgi:putative oxygen-independent coproporphyrinogen III oxidase
VSPRLPDGEPAPPDGTLPAAALATLGQRPFGVYVHVPYCAARCGYCDFNTYVPGAGLRTDGFAAAVLDEWELAGRVLGGAPPPADSVFFGGGTPTLLDPDDLARVLAAIALGPGAEVTIEANPESVDAARLEALRRAGFNRISLGMQSAAPHVLATLDRRHAPGRPEAAARLARAAGFEHVSLDLIYGTPGETVADWEASLSAAIGAGVDHVSAYALTVEPGTALAARVRRGALAAPDDGAQADRYRRADALLGTAGLRWYELSNWGSPCRHNLGYWRSHDWWGLGPGAHSHVGGVRWWNVLHPDRHAAAARAGESPAAGREQLDADQRRTERVLLGLRLAAGLALEPPEHDAAAELCADGLLDAAELRRGRARLTLAGRLLADRVALRLLGPGQRAPRRKAIVSVTPSPVSRSSTRAASRRMIGRPKPAPPVGRSPSSP